MNFEINTSTKVVTLLTDIKIGELDLIKRFLGDDADDWLLSFKQVTQLVKEWVPIPFAPSMPIYPLQPYYDLNTHPGYNLPNVYCSVPFNYKIEGVTEQNVNSVKLGPL